MALVDVETTADAARLGSWLALLDALVVGATGWYADPRSGAATLLWQVVGVGGFTGLALAAARVRWNRLRRGAAGAFPLVGSALLAMVGLLAPQAAGAYLPLLTAWAVYVGLTAPRGTMVRCLPAFAAAWLAMTGPPDPQRLVRLALTCVVWVLIAEVLALRAASDTVRTRDLTLQAETDPLTGLANRRALEIALQDLRAGDVVAVVDLDHFKRVNDTRGHQHGDEVLVGFARTLRAAARRGDLVARFGGEEFVLLLRDDEGGGHAGPAGPAVLRRLGTLWPRLHPSITWSAGVSTHRHGRTAEQTVADADAALYRAKRAGRNRVVTAPSGEPVGAWPHGSRRQAPATV